MLKFMNKLASFIFRGLVITICTEYERILMFIKKLIFPGKTGTNKAIKASKQAKKVEKESKSIVDNMPKEAKITPAKVAVAGAILAGCCTIWGLAIFKPQLWDKEAKRKFNEVLKTNPISQDSINLIKNQIKSGNITWDDAIKMISKKAQDTMKIQNKI